jgi:hypothetical protein
MTAVDCIVAVGNIEADIEILEDQKSGVGRMAVGKLPQAVYTVLVRRIHNPHLVNHHMGLVEEHKEIRSKKT